MIADVSREAKSAGLELRPDKTKILHNIQRRKPRQQPEYTHTNDLTIEVLPYGSTQKYLGKLLTFRLATSTEIDNRIASSWRKFHFLKQELTTKSYSLKGRLRLFHGTVTPTMLYA